MLRQKRYPDAYGLDGRTLILSATLVGAVSLVSAFCLREYISGITLLVAVTIVTCCLLRKTWIDNRHTALVMPHWRKALAGTILFFAPVAFVLWLAFSAGLWVDDQIERGIQWSQARVIGHIEWQDITIEEEIEEQRSWWNPAGWLYGSVKRKVLRTYQTQVLTPASVAIRTVYSLIYGILRLVQYVSYCSLAYMAIRSFVFLFVRAILYAGGTVKFRLPHSRELAYAQPLLRL